MEVALVVWSLTVIVDLQVVLEMVEVVHVELVEVPRVLQRDDVLPLERFVRQQVFPVLRLDVQLFDGL